MMMIGGFAVAWYGYIRDLKAPVGWASQNPLLYKFLWHKWYFDELYDMVFVQARLHDRPLFWRRRRRRHHR